MPVKGDNSLYFATGLDNSGLIQGTSEAAGIVEKLGDTIEKINPFGKLAGTAITVFFGIAAAATKMVSDYEKEMDKVRAISAQTEEEFDRVRKQIFSIAEDTPTVPRDLAKAYYEIVSAGYEGAKAVTLLKQATQNADGGLIDVADSAERLSSILNTYNRTVEDATNVSDKLFKAADIGGIKFDELTANLDKLSPVAQNFNLPFEQVLANVVALSEKGTPVSKAINIIKTTLQKTTDVLGDGYTNLYTYEEALQAVYEQAGGSEVQLKKMLGSYEAVNGVLAVTGDNAGRVSEIMDQLNDSQGLAAEKSLRVAEASGKQWSILSNRIKSALETMGSRTLDIIDDLAGSINKVTREYDTQSRQMAENAARLQVLTEELRDTNLEEERRAEIFGILDREYSDYLGNINLEKTNLNDLIGILESVNQKYIERIAIQKILEENNEKEVEASEKLVKTVEARKNLNQLLATIRQKTGLELDRELELEEAIAKLRNELIDSGKDFAAASFSAGTGSGGVINASNQILNLKTNLISAQEEYKTASQAAANFRKQNEEAIKTEIEIVAPDKTEITGSIEEQLLAIAEAKTKLGLAPYLESDNERVKAAAKERLQVLREMNKPPEDSESYAEFLSRNIKAYEDFYATIGVLTEEEAQAEYAILKERGRNSEEFLQNELKKAEDFSQKRDIILAAENAGVNLGNTNQKVKVTPEIDLQQVDTTSINALNKRLKRVIDDFNAAQSDAERQQLGAKIRILEKEIEEAENAARAQYEIFKDLQFDLEDLSIRSLRKRKDETIKSFEDILKDFKGTDEERQKILDEYAETMDAINREIGEKFQQNVDQLADAMGNIGDIFTKFGEEDLGNLFKQIQGVVKGIGTLGKGLASNNPFEVVAGVAEIVKSGITVEIVSDTAKFEEAIKRLNKSVEQLDYALSKAIGTDRIESRKELIDAQKELEELSIQAAEAEEKARKETKFLGITVARKGEGSGTDPEKVEEFQRAAEEARRKVEELNTEIQELYTGTTEKTIVDSIVDGFREGKRSITDFAGTFEELMRNAVLESLKIKYLEKDIERFFDEFADAAETGSGLDTQEVNALRDLFNTIITDNEHRLNALNQILGEAGVASQSFGERQGLSGEISTITEETATVLAGTLNNIRLDVGAQLSVIEESNKYLAGINDNTANMLPLLSDMKTRLRQIEKLLG